MVVYLAPPANWVDVALVGLIVMGFLIGMSQGLVRQMLNLVGIYVAAVLALQYHHHVSRWAGTIWPHTDSWARTTFAMSLVFVVAFAALHILSYTAYGETRLSFWSFIDRAGGALAGTLGSWVLAAIAVNLVSLAFRFNWAGWEDLETSVATQFNDSFLVPFLFSNLPTLFNLIRPWLPIGLPAPFLM